ncbi:MAG: radical SAM family heme chaperone HemW [Aminivibrio sp.]|jgi:oxygen-independent coproporphyrinogen-3 oxidase
MKTEGTLREELKSYFAELRGPYSVYVHLPFCLRKCPYCSFLSVPAERASVASYLEGLKREVLFYSRLLRQEAGADTLYFGGGTPTLLSPGQWDDLLSFMRGALNISEEAEITAEANPESLTQDHCRVWRDGGVTRASIGVQSFNDEELTFLGRPHDGQRAQKAVLMAVDSGFSVSADLMFGLQGQTLRSWASSVKKALSLNVDHLSLYQLAIEEGCHWSASPPGGLADGYPLYRWSQWYLPQKDFIQYEIASFSLPGCRSRHNGAYWNRSPVLGLGAGAWGFVGGIRYSNESDLLRYEAGAREERGVVAEVERLEGISAAREAAVLMLRTREGIQYGEFLRMFGPDALGEILETVRQTSPSDCYREGDESLSLTQKGMRVANRIWSAII